MFPKNSIFVFVLQCDPKHKQQIKKAEKKRRKKNRKTPKEQRNRKKKKREKEEFHKLRYRESKANRQAS